MQDIRQETLNECTGYGAVGQRGALGNRPDSRSVENVIFSVMSRSKKVSRSPGRGDSISRIPIDGGGFEMNGKGSSTRPSLTVSNLYGMVTGMAEDMQSLVGGTVVRRKVYARFLDAVNFVNGNSDADPEQEVISRWRIEQCSELRAMPASFVLSTPTETDGALFFRGVSCWPTPVPGPIAVMSAVIAVRLSRMNMTSHVRYHEG